MSKRLKIILTVMLAALCLGSLGIWYASTLIKPAQITQLLSSSVKDATGRDLRISGPVSLKLFPSLGITIEQASLSNASWSSNPDMLAVKHLELDIQLLPLLRGEVEFNAINMNGVDIFLQTNKSGDGNWDFSSPDTPSSASNSSSSSTQTVDPVKIRRLTIADARLNYQDFGSSAKQISISKLTVNGGFESDEISAQATYANYQFGIKGKVSSIHQVLNDWNVKPTQMKLDLNFALNGKAMDIVGDIDKKPQALPTFNINLSSKSFELGVLAGSAALASAGTNSMTKATSPAPKENFFFTDNPLPFDLLPEANGKLSLNIDELRISGHVPMTNVKGAFVFNGTQININDLSLGLGKGSAQIQASFSQFQSTNPAISIKGLAKGFTLEQLMDAVDANTKVKGGDAEVAFNLRSSGSSMHQLASRANGAIQISVGKGSLDSRFIDQGGDLLITIVNAVNPMRKTSDQTVLECAVIYLPMSNGLVTLNDSIGVVTDRLDMVLSGSVDLKTEALNIKIDPREKSGLTTGVNLAGLVKLQGTLLKPQTGVNKEGVVNSAVSIGLGILTGGATILAENAKSIATKSQPCKAALHSWSDIYPGAN